MKISQMIAALQKLQEEHGDLELFWADQDSRVHVYPSDADDFGEVVEVAHIPSEVSSCVRIDEMHLDRGWGSGKAFTEPKQSQILAQPRQKALVL